MKPKPAVTRPLRYFHRFETALSIISAIVVVFLMLLTVVDVFLRYVFNNPIQGSYEVAQFLMVGVVFLGVSYVQAVRGHVAVGFLTGRMPKKARQLLIILAWVMGLAIYVVVTWQGALLAWGSWVTHDYTMGIIHYPLWPAQAVIPLGAGVLCIRLILDIINDTAILLGRGGEEEGEAAVYG